MENPFRSALDEDGTAHVTVRGEIDFSNADDLASGIREALGAWSPAQVRIDLAEAAFIDSTGLGALIEGYRATVEAGSRFVVVNPSESFRRVLAVTGLSELFGVPNDDQVVGLSRATGT